VVFTPAAIPVNARLAPRRRSGQGRFETAWREFLAKRTEADFQTWRDDRDQTAEKSAMWDRVERMPAQKPSSL
jgi:hypothetical protein